MNSGPLPPAEYYATLPKAIVGAGAVFHDAQHRILLVKPTYSTSGWEIPGGGMDLGEYPLQTAQREIKEELGLDVQLGQLLVVDWVPPQPDGRPALVNFLFDGGLITEDWASNLQLDAGELSEWRLCTSAERAELLEPHMARRLDACAELLESSSATTVYLHHGWNPLADR
jgi:8-oxo-dGTP pyrophosphatase MutT (NUDIX family)